MKDPLVLYYKLSKIVPWYNKITPPNIVELANDKYMSQSESSGVKRKSSISQAESSVEQTGTKQNKSKKNTSKKSKKTGGQNNFIMCF
jgi:hypothetical protein